MSRRRNRISFLLHRLRKVTGFPGSSSRPAGRNSSIRMLSCSLRSKLSSKRGLEREAGLVGCRDLEEGMSDECQVASGIVGLPGNG